MAMNMLEDSLHAAQGINIKAYVTAYEQVNQTRVPPEVLARIRKLIANSLYNSDSLESLVFELDSLSLYRESEHLLLNAVNHGNHIANVLIALRYLEDAQHNFSFGTRIRNSRFCFGSDTQLEGLQKALLFLHKAIQCAEKQVPRKFLVDLRLMSIESQLKEGSQVSTLDIIQIVENDLSQLRFKPTEFAAALSAEIQSLHHVDDEALFE